ncbi:hypothetical protein R3P38DRAFT_3388809 [Favolaschia claudopus]|uniref:Uncharacterized protein n=1 Tax=Favolaschia claudopus TaxID=2862362 RepID=A0AAW0CW71_9AGAR
MFTLLSIPPEVRGLILDFCFPPPQAYIQIVPYRTTLAACRLNLPVELYRVCKLIHSELEPLPAKLRRLDLTYIIRGPLLPGYWRPEYGVKHPDDRENFPFIMRYAERVRLVGAGPVSSRGRGLSSPSRILKPGPECALKVLEVQPRCWRRWSVARVMLNHLGPLTTHPEVAERLEVHLIRDPHDPFVDNEEIKTYLRNYEARRVAEEWEGPIWIDVAALDEPVKEPRTNFRKIETWLKRFQDVKDKKHRMDKKGPLGGHNDSDDSE